MPLNVNLMNILLLVKDITVTESKTYVKFAFDLK